MSWFWDTVSAPGKWLGSVAYEMIDPGHATRNDRPIREGETIQSIRAQGLGARSLLNGDAKGMTVHLASTIPSAL